MNELILFPDAEAVLTTWLRAALAERGVSVPVGTAVPNPRPGRFVRVLRTGGPVADLFLLDNPTVVIEAWASTEAVAADLARLARGLIHKLAGLVVNGTTVYRVDELAGPGNLPDPTTGMARYTFTVSMLLRGSAA